MPLKLFEAVGNGLPVICSGQTAVSDFVKDNDIGWIVEGNNIQNIFDHLLKNPIEIKEKRHNVLQIQNEHTWTMRAKRVAEVLLSKA